MILGIDYGERRLGLALADETIKIPLPFKILQNQGEKKLLEEIKEIIQAENVSLIVLGLPLTLKGEEGYKAKECKEFGDLLQQKLHIKVELLDERLSSRLADTLAGGNNKNRDIGAAMIILEGYLGGVPKV